MRAPIIIMSFNRPQFLGPDLGSLKGQRPDTLEGREIHLFQDGAVNRYSRLCDAREPQARTDEAPTLQRREMAVRVSRMHQRRQAATRSRSLPLQGLRRSEPLGGARRHRRQRRQDSIAR